jgi:L-seryl-tRNA(Ser) seleniumtransferase
MDDSRARALRSLPSVHALLDNPQVRAITNQIDAAAVAEIVRHHVDSARTLIINGDVKNAEDLLQHILSDLDVLSRRVPLVLINGTGVIVQTNLGRSPVSTDTAEAMRTVASNYVPLETNLVTGQRGGRGHEVDVLMRALTGAERTLVVNNNASAVLLMLSALTRGQRVIVSRSDAVEIGGGFRIPDVMRQSGALLSEVGTTNRTYLNDYAAEIDSETAALLRVHASNFAVIGFTAKPDLCELVSLAHERSILALEDVGSGCLLDTAPYGLEHEPTLAESIADGVDVVCASGDKLLGGPQAGLILGRAAVVERIARHPLARAVRADKTCLAGIAATLRHYVRAEATEHIPVWWSISRDPAWLKERANGWAAALGDGIDILAGEAVIGGGSLPGKTLPSWAIGLPVTSTHADELARRLRTGATAVVPRITDGRVLIDARTVLPDQDDALIRAVRAALSEAS